MRFILLPLTGLLWLAACETSDDKQAWEDTAPPPNPTGAVTETLPQFYDRVPNNLIFISIDTFRRDHMRRYGKKDNLVPFLDDLAESGFTLDDHTQCSNWTFNATTCTLMGRYTIEDGWAARLGRTFRLPVPAGTPLLASYLGDAGFYSILVSNNSWLSAQWGNAQGYDVFRTPDTSGAMGIFNTGLSELLTARDSGDAKRWFLHLHVLEPHAAYNPPEEYLKGLSGLPPIDVDLSDKDAHYEMRDQWPDLSAEEQDTLEQHLRARYAGELTWLDDQLQIIFADLGARGLLDDALVVIWNDHGEQFWEHGHQTHAYNLHPEENDGVALFWAPNIIPQAWSEPTTAIDLVPTLLSLFDIPIPEEVSGIPVGQAPADRPRLGFALARTGLVQSILVGKKRLQFHWNGNVQVYDRSKDPGETVDLFDPNAPDTLALWQALLPWVELGEAAVEEQRVSWPAGLPHP